MLATAAVSTGDVDRALVLVAMGSEAVSDVKNMEEVECVESWLVVGTSVETGPLGLGCTRVVLLMLDWI